MAGTGTATPTAADVIAKLTTLEASNAELVTKAANFEAKNAALETTIAEIKTKAAAIPNYNIVSLANGDRVFAVPKGEQTEDMWGFKSFAHFMHEVRQCPKPDVPSPYIAKMFDSEMVKKAALGMGELVGSDGGFLVPPGFSTKIFERVYNENNLLAKTDQYPLTGNSMTFPRNNESSRVDGSRWGGVRSYWVQEGSTITQSSPTFGQVRLDLHKLATIVPLTSELKQDTTSSGVAIDAYLTKVFASEIAFETGKAIYRGNGVGRPLGMINAACAVTVSAEVGQAAATINSQNVVKMWARRFALGPTGQYMWLINQDAEPQLSLLTLGIGTAGIATYMPPGGLSEKGYMTLKGAPVQEIEWASTLGTVGDIALVDPTQYITANHGGPNTMTSLHVYFTTDQEAVRTTWRVDGKPWWATALTPFQGTNTQSPIVVLATR